MAPIVVGCGSNVQDGTVVHADNGFPCKIGNGTSIGHNAIIHGCTIGNNTVIGMGAIIMNGAQVGSDCIIGAGSLVTQGTGNSRRNAGIWLSGKGNPPAY